MKYSGLKLQKGERKMKNKINKLIAECIAAITVIVIFLAPAFISTQIINILGW